ncbi:cell wall hydrolase [Peribacillus muralis]|uniref:cell wall hydrolase n=1 Tax=Peribacillus muralis TaxID=264697 RepID=UPI003D088AE3
MKAEANGEGVQGMNMVGTVVANRVEADCSPDFKGLRYIKDAIYQTIPGTDTPHFEPVLHGSLCTQRPNEADLQKARDVLHGYRDPLCGFSIPAKERNTELLVPPRCLDRP